MKNFVHEFSDEDISTLLCTLSTYSTVNTDDMCGDVQQQINIACCESAIEKLIYKRTDFLPNEVRMMAVSLTVANMALKGQLQVDEKTKKEYYDHLFSINRLHPIFDKIFDYPGN